MGKRVLIVDDDPVIRMLLSEYLSTHGHSVETLCHGSACLDRLRTDKPDVLILDVFMPDMTGQQVLAQIREEENTSQIPVIMLSANSQEDVAEYAHAGVKADSYIQKPFDMKLLLEAINETVRDEESAKVSTFVIGS